MVLGHRLFDWTSNFPQLGRDLAQPPSAVGREDDYTRCERCGGDWPKPKHPGRLPRSARLSVRSQLVRSEAALDQRMKMAGPSISPQH
jgi:hypothetical protein